MSYITRQTAPLKDNKYYYSKLNAFYPKYNSSCTWYSHGRTLENGFSVKGIPLSNAENWYLKCTVDKGLTPYVGSIICWSKGKIGVGSDGAGHVAVVEKVYEDGTILCSEHGKNSGFYTKKHKPPYSYGKYKFEGFIYPKGMEKGNIPTPPKPIPEEVYYTIVKGDNLTKIAKKYKTTIKKLMSLNPQIKDKNKIYAGHKIRVK